MLVGDIPRRNAYRYPNKTAVVCGERRLTWAQVNERTNRLANALLKVGLQKGERVGVYLSNVLEYVEIIYACAKAGLVIVPVNFRFTSREVAYHLKDSGARCVFTERALVPRVKEVLVDTPVEFLIGIGEAHSCPLDYDTLLLESSPEEPPRDLVNKDDLRIILYTSGTTGKPKGSMHSQESMLHCTINHIREMNMAKDDVCMLNLPFCTAGGMVQHLVFTYLGQTLVIIPKWDPEYVLSTIEKERVTVSHVVPTMIIDILNSPAFGKYNISSLRMLGYGSAPISPTVLREAITGFKCDFCQVYGASEAGGFCTFLSPEDHREALRSDPDILLSCGKESAYADVRIFGEHDEELPPGEIGEIVVRSDANCLGYLNMPEASKELLRGGWVHTGDMARKDERGYIYIVDRKKHMIISGAFNIYPAEIEKIIARHPGIRDVAVIGIPHERWGETPLALIVLKDTWKGKELRVEEEVMNLCREQLAGYKRPSAIEFRDTFPISPAGKIMKRVLREPYWKGRERRVN